MATVDKPACAVLLALCFYAAIAPSPTQQQAAQQQQQAAQQQSPGTGFFGLGQQPPWANNNSGGGPTFAGAAPFTGGGNFVFGASHPTAAHPHAAEAEMES